MEYRLYQMDFYNGVRFGEGNLDSTAMVFHADTLFSALYQEALKLKKEESFLENVRNRKILFSDAFPYMGKQYFVPKPISIVEQKENEHRGNSVEKKLYKKMQYIPMEYIENYLNGEFPGEHLEDLREIGRAGMKVSVGIRGNEVPSPYQVSTFYFKEGSGLYFLAAFENKAALELLEELLESLSYSGIGGKRSAGLGRFEFLATKVPEHLEKGLQTRGSKNMLLSVALPDNEEMEEVLSGATYTLIRRGGFVASETYAKQALRKRERYLFAPGSCFQTIFAGKIAEEYGGSHPVYRYEQALFLGVTL